MTQKSFGRSALELAITIFAVVWLLDRAWKLLHPLLPIICTVVVLLAVFGIVFRQRNNW